MDYSDILKQLAASGQLAKQPENSDANPGTDTDLFARAAQVIKNQQDQGNLPSSSTDTGSQDSGKEDSDTHDSSSPETDNSTDSDEAPADDSSPDKDASNDTTPDEAPAAPTEQEAPDAPEAPEQAPMGPPAPPNLGQTPVPTSMPGQIPSGYGAGLDDSALKAAQDNAKQMRLVGMLGNAGSTISSALSRGNAKNMQAGQGLIDNANVDFNDIMARRKGADEDTAHNLATIQLATEKEKSDPTSQVSQLGQQLATKLAGAVGMDLGDVSKASFSQLQNIFPGLEKYAGMIQSKQMRQDTLSDKRDQKQKDLEEKNIGAAQKAMNADKAYVSAVQGKDAADEANAALDEAVKNPGAAQAIPTIMARLSTHGQRINSTEIHAMTGGMDAMDYAHRIANKIATGTLTPQDYSNFKKLVTVYQNDANNQMTQHQERYAKQYSSAHGGDLANNFYKLTGNQYTPKPDVNSSSASTGNSTTSNRSPQALNPDDVQAITWAKSNPNDPRAKQILQMHGM